MPGDAAAALAPWTLASPPQSAFVAVGPAVVVHVGERVIQSG